MNFDFDRMPYPEPFSVSREAFAADVAQMLAAYAANEHRSSDLLEALALVEMDLGRPPSCHRNQMARWAACLGFIGEPLPEYLDLWDDAYDLGQSIAVLVDCYAEADS